MEIRFAEPTAVMRRAIELARHGEGHVEPNPMVGAVVVDADLRLISEGHHERYGGLHAEPNALQRAGDRARGATLFVTLEPCAHHGKTPPCADAVIASGIRRVVIGCRDPFPQVDGRGIEKLRAAGIDVEIGVLEVETRELIAPFLKLVSEGRPWVHAKWAMTLDGRIASRTRESKWISNAESRCVVHALRGRMDAILTGLGTVLADDPQLTARPAGSRTPVRVVVDSLGRLPVESQLVRTAREVPVLVACTDAAPEDRKVALRRAGVEVVCLPTSTGLPPGGDARNGTVDLRALLLELGKRRVTNLLVEAGGQLLGSLADARLIDEVHVFVAPRLLGGQAALSPLLGVGQASPADALVIPNPQHQVLGGDVYIRGRIGPQGILGDSVSAGR